MVQQQGDNQTYQKEAMKGKLALLLCGLLFGLLGHTQNISNKGREFWVGYGHHQFMEDGSNTQVMTLYLSAEDQPATVTVTIDSSGPAFLPASWWRRTYNIPAFTVISIEDPGTPAASFSASAGPSGQIPKGAPGFGYDARLYTDPPPVGTGGAGVFRRKGIHIESSVPIVAYAHIYGSASSGATMLLPTDAWGTSYVSVNSKQDYASNCYNWMYVIAQRDNTTIEVTPSTVTRAQNLTGLAPNAPSTITLMKGQIYQVIGANVGADVNGNGGTSAQGRDLTGTKVRSIAGPGGDCYPIAVFAGSSRTSNPASCGSGGGDNDNQQLFPQHAWGKKYLTTPFSGSTTPSSFSTSTYKIAVKDPTTQVKKNGVVLPLGSLINGSYYMYESSTADLIEADKPVLVVQFMTGGGCLGSGGLGDPEMVVLSPVEQAIKQVGFYRNDEESINVNYLTLVLPTAGVASLRIDGGGPATFSHTYLHPNLTGYTVVIKRWTAAKAQCLVKCDSAFNAITYGLGSVESYAYSAGAYINNLNAISGINNILDTTNGGNNRHLYTCVKTPVRISALMRYQPTRLLWQFSALGAAITPNADVLTTNPATIADGTVIVNGITYYKYTLPATYTFNAAGTYSLPLQSTSLTVENCNNTEQLYISFEVKPKPDVDFTFSHTTGCVKDTIFFFGPDATGSDNAQQWLWTFPDGTTSQSQDTAKLLTVAGVNNINLKAVSAVGCLADTTKQITTFAPPTADFTTNPPVICPKGTVTFTPSQSYGGPVPVNGWYWDFGNTTTANATAGTPQTSMYDVPPGTYTIKLVTKVSTLCISDTASKIITVTAPPAKPVATSPVFFCQNSTATALTATAAAGNTLTWYDNPALTGGSATAPVPVTTTAGTFYYYVNQTNTASGCTSDTTRIMVTITNGITGNTIGADQTICSGTSPATLAGTGTLAGGSGTYTYQWQQSTDGGANWSDIPAATNATLDPAAVTGAIQYRRIVSDGSCSATSNAVTITVIGSMGSYDISASQTICAGQQPALLDGQTPTGGNGTFTYQWESSPNGTAWTVIASATAEDYQPPVLATTMHFRRKVTSGICSATSSVVIITVNPTPTATLTGPASICGYDAASVSFTATAGTAPFNIQLTITGPSGPSTITQTVATNGPVSIGVLPVGSPAGTYTIALTNITDANCTKTTGLPTVTINVTAVPVVAINPTAASLCNGKSVTLTASGATTYTWSPATGLSATTGATVTANPTATTTYTVTGTTNGCTDNETVTVTVNPVPNKPVVSATPVAYCQNATATALTATADAGNTLTWYTNPGLTGGTTTAPVPSTATAGSVTYYVTQTNGTSCESQASTITVNVSPVIANNTISAGQTICAGQSAATLTVAGLAGGTGTYAYQWQQSTNGGGTWSNIAGATASTVSPGTVAVTTQYRLQVTSGLCSSQSNVVTITVVPLITNYNIAAAQTICAATQPTLLDGQTSAGGTGTFTYQWESSPDGSSWSPVAGATAEDYQPPVLNATTHYRRKTTAGPCPVTSNVVIITVNPIPNGNITTAATSICAYDAGSITFNSTQGVAPFAVGLTIAGPSGNTVLTNNVPSSAPVTINVIAANSPAGSYTITLDSIKDNTGCARRGGFTPVTITVKPQPVVTTNTPAPVCAGNTATLTATGATTYAWSPATGLSATTGATVTANPATTTTYQVTGTTNGCTSAPVSVTVTVNPLPAKPVVTAAVKYCQNETATALTATASAGHTLTWYNNPALTGGSATAPVPSTATVGSTNYYVTQTNTATGCVSEASMITVTINPVPVANFDIPVKICLPGPASFTNRSTIADNSVLTYVWDFGDGTGSSTQTNPSYTYAGAGSYPVVLAATSAAGCVNISAPKLVDDFYEKPIAAFTVTPEELCQGSNTVFADASLPAGSITDWSWNFGDGSTSTGPTPTKKYNDPGNFTVTLIVKNAAGCTSDPTPHPVTVHYQPRIDAGRSFVVPQGTTIKFEATLQTMSNNPSTLTFDWSPATGLSDATALQPTLVANADQVYTLTATGDFGCTATDELTVKILKPVNVPNVFSPNGDNVHDQWRIPNLADYPGCTVEIFNRYGQQVFYSVGYNTPWDGTYKGKDMPVGTYYYVIKLENGFKPISGSVTIIR